MAIAIKAVKPGKAARPYEACAEMISATGEVEKSEAGRARLEDR